MHCEGKTSLYNTKKQCQKKKMHLKLRKMVGRDHDKKVVVSNRIPCGDSRFQGGCAGESGRESGRVEIKIVFVKQCVLKKKKSDLVLKIKYLCIKKLNMNYKLKDEK